MNVSELTAALLSLPSEMKHLPVVLIDETQGMPITFQINSLKPWKPAGRRAVVSCITLSEERSKGTKP